MADDVSIAHFSDSDGERIAKAVRRVEAMPTDRTGRRGPQQGNAEQSFWAKLAGRSLDGKRFSWLRVRPDGAGGWQGYDPAVQGEQNAVEINGHQGVPGGAIVRMHLTDYDADGKPLFTFQYETLEDRGPMPVHDHRDNFNGGFAFAVFHPGTSLPQQQWAI